MISANTTEDFATYSCRALNYSKWLGISRHILKKGKLGNYFVSRISSPNKLLYGTFYLNSIIKVLYLVAVLINGFGPIKFLERIASLDYFLCGVLILFGTSIWDSFLHERICQLWEVETKIFCTTGSPPQMTQELGRKHRRTIGFHFIMVFLGCASLAIQFYTEPKHFSFTYSIIEEDNAYLRVIFCAHEIVFMGHAWFCNAGSNSMVTFVADNLSITLKQLIQVVHDMEFKVSKGVSCRHPSATYLRRITSLQTKNTTKRKLKMNQGQSKNLPKVNYDSPQTFRRASKGQSVQQEQRIFKRRMHAVKEKGDEDDDFLDYDIEKLLTDLQRLSLATRIFNDGIAYKLGGLILTGYCQYIASTCLAFQVIRNEGGGIDDIWFYLQDCIASCYHAFRVFNHMSEVLPLADELFFAIKRYEAKTLCFLTREQKLRHQALTKISMNVGPIPMNKMTVLHSMQSLVGYYLCVALW